MSVNAPGSRLKQFMNQTVEFQKVLQFREHIEDFLSKDSETISKLYELAESHIDIEQSEANIIKREAILDALNINIMQTCLDDSDNDVLQILYTSRLIPTFFQQAGNQEKFSLFRELHINGQNLLTLPESIISLKNIIILNLSGNKLRNLPDILTKTNFPSLKLINLQNNPISIGTLNQLQEYSSCNDITLIADGIDSTPDHAKTGYKLK